MLTNTARRYQIPTHLGTPDTIDLPLLGITVSVTIRQGICFLLGGSLAFHLWEQSFGLLGIVGLLMHWVIPCLLASITYVLAIHEIRDRYLEAWIVVCWFYWRRPKVFVWYPVPMMTEGTQFDEEENKQYEHSRKTGTNSSSW